MSSLHTLPATVTHCGLHFCGAGMCQSAKQGSVFVPVIYCYAAHPFPVAITLGSVVLAAAPLHQTLATLTPSLSQMALMCFYLHMQILDDSQCREPLRSSALLTTTCFSPASRERRLSAAANCKATPSVQRQFELGAA